MASCNVGELLSGKKAGPGPFLSLDRQDSISAGTQTSARAGNHLPQGTDPEGGLAFRKAA